MTSANSVLAGTSAAIFAFYFGTASCGGTDLGRSLDSGQPHELINQPVCWSSEFPDHSRNCDFALKS